MSIINILVGIILLVSGRRLFWLLLAALGFAFGWFAASQLFHVQNTLTALIVAGVCGVIGALLTIFLERLAVEVAGFLAGAYLASALFGAVGQGSGPSSWIVFIVGGLIGVVLVALIFEWALVILSSLAGASLIVGAVHLSQVLGFIALIALFAIGVALQTRRDKPRRRRERPA